MQRIALTRSIRPTSLRSGTATATRPFSLSAYRLNKGPPTTQGHSTDKAHQTGHSDGDVQSASVRAGQNARSTSGSADADAQPFDAAQQGSSGGTAKPSEAKAGAKDKGQEGALKDQVGGQDESSPGVAYGEKVEAAAESFTGAAKQAVGTGFDSLKKLRSPHTSYSRSTTTTLTELFGPSILSFQPAYCLVFASLTEMSPGADQSHQFTPTQEGKNFHTSARAYAGSGASPSADAPGARDPKETGLHGDQNEHLSHKGAASRDSGKGNAADEPHLPSKSAQSQHQKPAAGSTSGQKRGFHSTIVKGAAQPPKGYAKAVPSEGAESGYNVPPTGIPKSLDQTYDSPSPPDAGLKPSSEAYSSTAVDPPNETLRKGALEGTLGERNEQPNAEVGRIGLKEAWKHRK